MFFLIWKNTVENENSYSNGTKWMWNPRPSNKGTFISVPERPNSTFQQKKLTDQWVHARAAALYTIFNIYAKHNLC